MDTIKYQMDTIKYQKAVLINKNILTNPLRVQSARKILEKGNRAEIKLEKWVKSSEPFANWDENQVKS